MPILYAFNLWYFFFNSSIQNVGSYCILNWGINTSQTHLFQFHIKGDTDARNFYSSENIKTIGSQHCIVPSEREFNINYFLSSKLTSWILISNEDDF